MDLHGLLRSLFDAVDSIFNYEVLGISIFIWLALFTVLFLVSDSMEKKIR